MSATPTADSACCPVCDRTLRGDGCCPLHGSPGEAMTVRQEVTTQIDPSKAGEETTARQDPLIGASVGEYVITRRVGSGGMGVVYEGLQQVIQRRVAIKIVRPDLASTREEMEHLIAEARAANAIQHRGIIGVFGSGELPGVGRYLVMEYLDGTPLDELIRLRAPMTFAEVHPVLDDILAALEAAHARGVIHRDLKPTNVFLVSESNGSRYAKLLDFGLAKVSRVPHGAAAQSSPGLVAGTPEYMAPEQACGRPVGPKTDLYAVGVIAFEMLAGRLPFEGATPLDVAAHHVRTPPPSLCALACHVDPRVEELVARLLEKAPEARPASAAAVRSSLKRLVRELQEDETRSAVAPSLAGTSRRPPAAASPPPALGAEARLETTRLARPRLRPLALAFALAAALALLLAIAAAVLSRRGGTPPSAAPVPGPHPAAAPARQVPAAADPVPPARAPPAGGEEGAPAAGPRE